MDNNIAKGLYDAQELETMRVADAARMQGKNRVEELMNFARISGVKRIGIANCISLQKEVEKLKAKLSGEFEVYAIDCKCGKIPAASLLGNDAKGISCNPSGQAAYLSENKTELNVSFGLCMGHDIIFNQKSQAPVTTLVVKDREHKHNPYHYFEQNDEQPL